MLLFFFGSYPFPGHLEDEVSAYLRALMTENYPEADRITEDIRSQLGPHPLVHLLYAARYEFYMVDYSTDSGEALVFAHCDSALALAKSMEASQPGPAHMYRGAALGIKAVQFARRKDVLRTLRYAKEAYDAFARAYAEDSGLYDCYLALGLYDLAMSYITKYIPWAPSQDRKRKAIQRLRLASEKGTVFSPFAFVALAFAYTFEGRVEEGLRYLSFLDGLYPGSRTLLWLRAQACYWGERWGMAYSAYSRVADRVAREQPDCHYCRAEALFYMADCAWRMGNPDRARELLDEAREELDRETSPGRARKIKELRGLIGELSSKLGR